MKIDPINYKSISLISAATKRRSVSRTALLKRRTSAVAACRPLSIIVTGCTPWSTHTFFTSVLCNSAHLVGLRGHLLHIIAQYYPCEATHTTVLTLHSRRLLSILLLKIYQIDKRFK